MQAPLVTSTRHASGVLCGAGTPSIHRIHCGGAPDLGEPPDKSGTVSATIEECQIWLSLPEGHSVKLGAVVKEHQMKAGSQGNLWWGEQC